MLRPLCFDPYDRTPPIGPLRSDPYGSTPKDPQSQSQPPPKRMTLPHSSGEHQIGTLSVRSIFAHATACDCISRVERAVVCVKVCKEITARSCRTRMSVPPRR